MGILDLNNILRAEAPHVFKITHLSQYRGKRIALDVSIFLYRYIRSCGNDGWVDAFISLLCCLKKFGIKTVCIFDGPEYPIEKEETRQKRRVDNNKIKQRRVDANEFLEKMDRKDNIDFTIADSILREAPSDTSKEGYRQALMTLDDKLMKQTIMVNAYHNEQAISVIKALGLAYFLAKGEAETLCCYLAIKGSVDSVMTEDTDVLAYGTPIMMSKIDIRSCTFTEISHKQILDSLEMTSLSFKDLCIMLSCDYNTRAKMITPKGKTVGIGMKKAWNIIQQHRTLDRIESERPDILIGPLKYRRCRELLTIPDYIDNVIIPYNKDIDIQELARLKRLYELYCDIEKIKKDFAPVEMCFE